MSSVEKHYKDIGYDWRQEARKKAREAKQANYGPLRIKLDNALEKTKEYAGVFLFAAVVGLGRLVGASDETGPSEFPD